MEELLSFASSTTPFYYLTVLLTGCIPLLRRTLASRKRAGHFMLSCKKQCFRSLHITVFSVSASACE